MSAGVKIDHIAPRKRRDVAEQKWFFLTFGEVVVSVHRDRCERGF